MQKEYFGFDSIESLGTVIEELSSRNILVVHDKTSFANCGAEEILKRLLRNYGVEYFSDFATNPKYGDVEKGIEVFRKAEPDSIVAVGGGSVIDMAKMINFFAANKLEPKIYVAKGNPDVKKAKPLIAIPTTAGTGSEATHFAVLYIGHTKYSVAHKFILPNVAIVDPQLTMSLPPNLTATTGMDALSQAIESYWCINSTQGSKEYAGESIKMVMANLETAVNNPTESARLAMAKAAHLAGKAINITQTTAPHAISYPLTSFFDIPHGHAAALTLSSMLVYNYQVCDDDSLDSRGSGYIRKTIEEIAVLLNAKDVFEAKEKIDDLMRSIGLETKLRPLGIRSPADIELIIENGFNPARAKNNPRRLAPEALRKILDSIY